MAKVELGTKRVCVTCGARFYDLQKLPAVCPKCATEQPIDQPKPRRLGGNVIEDKRIKKPIAPGVEDAEVELEVAEDEAEEDVLEDTADLEDDAASKIRGRGPPNPSPGASRPLLGRAGGRAP